MESDRTASELTRHTCDDGRLYTDGSNWFPSVSTVLDTMDTPAQLRRYEQNTSAQKQRWTQFYTQHRGTLIHYELLAGLVDDEFWGDDEQTSEDALKGRVECPNTGMTGDQETWEQFQADRAWAVDTWKTYIEPIYGVDPETTIDVEVFVRNEEQCYAGQFDLLRVDDGDVVLCDLKTSKRVYDKHLLQLVAYAHAVDIVVDRLDVIRLNPDGQTWEVSRSDTWVEGRDDLWDEFCTLRDQLDADRIQGLKNEIATADSDAP
jgi:hypothetical protein